ncbi:hypothetical protein [uncultured Cellulomonas sp.]|uniref:hypothetical protein n=1 Tax=uncultured Cellulomonas sp. TaxID=189682 RepID=UPI002620CD70|nr:hypothetical protein [uncultured Cellulomonas sp.]
MNVHMPAGLIDNLTTQAVDLTTLFKTGVTLAILVFVAIYVFKGGFSLAKLAMGALVGGLLMWLVVGNGITTVQQQVGNDLAAAVPVSVSRHV